MAISIPAVSAGFAKTDGTDVSVTFPTASMAAGDWIYLFGGHFYRAGVSIGPTTGSWEQLYSENAGGSTNACGLWRKLWDGSESSVTCYGTGNAIDGVCYARVIVRGSDVVRSQATPATGSTSTPDPPAATVTTGLGDAVIFFEQSTVSDASKGTVPSGYTCADTNANSTNDMSLAVGYKLAPSTSDNPGTYSAWANGTWRALTIAIQMALNPATALTIGSPVFGTPVCAILADVLPAATALTVGSPVLGTPASGPAITAAEQLAVQLLLHCDGTSGSTTFTDSSTGVHTVTPHGAAQIATAESEFAGAGSAYFNSSADYLSLDSATDFTFGTGDFTIDFWAKRANTDVPNVFLDFTGSGATNAPKIYYDAGGLHYWCNGTDAITYSTTLTVGAWYHIAVTRSGTNTKMFLNGTQVGSTYTASDNLTCVSTGPLIGASPASFESETTAWESAVVTAGGLVSSGRKIVVNDLIAGLKSDGVWTKLDRLWLFAAENSQSALIDLKENDASTAVSSPTFTTDRGYNGNASSSYIDTTYNPSTDGVNYTQDSASGGVWDLTAPSAGNDAYLVGAHNGGAVSIGIIPCLYYNGVFYVAVNGAASTIAALGGSAPGFFAVNRSTSTAIQLYRNGSLDNSATDTSAAVPSYNIFVGALNYINTPASFSSDQAAACFFGGHLTATEHGNLYNRLRTYMTAVGVS